MYLNTGHLQSEARFDVDLIENHLEIFDIIGDVWERRKCVDFYARLNDKWGLHVPDSTCYGMQGTSMLPIATYGMIGCHFRYTLAVSTRYLSIGHQFAEERRRSNSLNRPGPLLVDFPSRQERSEREYM